MTKTTTAAGPIARVDPLAPRGPLQRAAARFVGSPQGTWLALHVGRPVDVWLRRVTKGRVTLSLSLPTLSLTTTGAKSGLERTTPVVYFSHGNDVILVASSFGRDKNPAWHYNLKANPRATLMRRGRSAAYTATEVVDEAERQMLFALADRIAGFAAYREKAGTSGREIPLHRLTLAETPR